ncbi:hypothetical protein BaRGS_00006745 [Batillaria attramentaria]|uniref:Uncharacterized protein n=1 Tax=Batillaria attramentaria TaxID=370345 RepID=A0ABD0LSE4_9CAEN
MTANERRTPHHTTPQLVKGPQEQARYLPEPQATSSPPALRPRTPGIKTRDPWNHRTAREAPRDNQGGNLRLITAIHQTTSSATPRHMCSISRPGPREQLGW